MRTEAWAIRSRRVATPEGVREAAVVIRGGTIAEVGPPDGLPPSITVEDCGDWLVPPGLVDTHVHINDPGRADWEGFATATAAAAAGGIAPGHDADLAIVDPEAPFVVDPSSLHHRHPATPYEGRSLVGRVVATYLRGSRISSDGRLEGEPTGRPLGGGLDWLNALGGAVAVAELLRCRGSRRWADRMAGLRPFGSEADLIEAADAAWRDLGEADRREAYAAHPRIGGLDALRARFASTAGWAAGEQAGVSGADEATLLALAEGNRAYEGRFGHTFIVCATGKTAGEMLGLLRGRLGNDPEAERAVAAGEQAAITRLRLGKLRR